MVCVACLTASIAELGTATMTSTFRRTNSAAKTGSLVSLPLGVAQCEEDVLSFHVAMLAQTLLEPLKKVRDERQGSRW